MANNMKTNKQKQTNSYKNLSKSLAIKELQIETKEGTKNYLNG